MRKQDMRRRDLSKALVAYAAGVSVLPGRVRADPGTSPHYARTEAEVGLRITPTNLAHVPGNVLRYGADPTGAADSATAFLNAQKVATQAKTELLIPGGSYKSSATLAWGFVALRVRAIGAVTITFMNPGQCITIDGGANGSGVYGVEISGYIRVVGNTDTTDAWFVRACHHSKLQMRAGDCTTALRTNWCVLTTFEITCSSNEATFSKLTPKAGIVADQRLKGETTAGCTFNVATLEGIDGIGIDLLGTLQCVFIGGSSEGNKIGVRQANADNVGNTFVGMDFESNRTHDVLVMGGSSLTFVNINANSPARSANIEVTGGDNTSFVGGYLRWLNVHASSSGTALFATQVADVRGLGVQGLGPVATFGIQKVNGHRAVTGRADGSPSDFSASAPKILATIAAAAKLAKGRSAARGPAPNRR